MPSSINTFTKLFLAIAYISISSVAKANPTTVVQPQDIIKVWKNALQPFLINPNNNSADLVTHELNFKSSLSLEEKKQALIFLKKMANNADQMRLDMWMNNTNINPDWLEMDAKQIKTLIAQNKTNDGKSSKIEQLLESEKIVTVLKILSRVQAPSAQSNALDKHRESCVSASANLKFEDATMDVETLKILRLICGE